MLSNGSKHRRWVAERTLGEMNRLRRSVRRREKKAANYLGLLHLAFAIIMYRRPGYSDRL